MIALFFAHIALAGGPERVWEAVPPAITTPNHPMSVVFGQDGHSVVVGSDVVESWDLQTGERRFQVGLGSGIRYAVAVVPGSGAVVAADAKGVVHILDGETGREVQRLGSVVTPVTASPAPHRPGSVPRQQDGAAGWVMGLAVSPDGALVAAAGIRGALGVWRISDGTRLPITTGPETARLESVAFTHDGGYLAIAGLLGDGNVRLYDVSGRTAPRTLPGTVGEGFRYGQAIAISPDDRTVAIGHWGGGVEVRRIDDGHVLWSDRASVNWAGPVRFTRDGGHLVVATPEGLVRYDADEGTGKMVVDDVPATGLAMAPDGRSLVTVHHYHARIRRLRLPDLELLDDPVR